MGDIVELLKTFGAWTLTSVVPGFFLTDVCLKQHGMSRISMLRTDLEIDPFLTSQSYFRTQMLTELLSFETKS